MKVAPPTTLRVCAFAALLACLTPRPARADGSASYKYEDYRESGGRIAVRTQGALLDQALGSEMRIKLQGVIDAITGATPNGEPAPSGSDQVPLTTMHERRKAWNADVSRQFQRVNLSLGLGNSREGDYVSNGWSANSLVDLNQKNTQLLVGLAGTDDKIKVLYSSIAPRQRKHTNDIIVGLTQLLDPSTSVTVNLTWGRQRGYLSDPYKLVARRIEVLPGVILPQTFGENRPAERDKWILLAGLNRAFAGPRGALDASYRYYEDTFGTRAHTVDLAWFQQLGARWVLRPGFRFYDQTAADFYHYDLNATSIIPRGGSPQPQGPFYSADYRLSALRSRNYGLKLVWTVSAALQFDVAVEQYDMRGRDGTTPRSAYPKARILTAGGKLTW